jgi:predicted GNAT family acetyltransferase
MTTRNEYAGFEYPDSAGYPDGSGFLDEGTAAPSRSSTADVVRDLDRPSAEADSEIRVHRDDTEQLYTATLGGDSVAEIRYDTVDGRIVVLSTTVAPAFRRRGIAEELIAHALDDIRDRGMRVTVYCPVVASFIAQNQQFSDVIDPNYPGR